tara:strand:- start:967 stop:1245 length:279 start_codon:yes stop_codon:yes gene_type:complete
MSQKTIEKEVKRLVLTRVPPGDRWTDAVNPGEVFESLTDGLEYVFQNSQGKDTEFHLSAFKGKIFSVHKETEQKETKRYSLYGEDTENLHVS